MTPKERWETLKAREHYTVEEIDAIDKDTPWSDLGEPAWWLEMMEARRVLCALMGDALTCSASRA